MAATFNKPKDIKYTDMAVYIDAHLPEIQEEGKNPEVEQRIYEYLYHLFYALSYKAGYFHRMEYYDDFALYGASELFLLLRKKLTPTDKVTRGKQQKPVKSSLNYIKAVLFPFKINYQKQFFSTVLNPDIDQDTAKLDRNLKNEINNQYKGSTLEYFTWAAKDMPRIVAENIKETPFRSDPYMYRCLYLSVVLSMINKLTLPNKFRSRLNKKEDAMSNDTVTEKYLEAYNRCEKEYVILWHLDGRWYDYVRILCAKVKSDFSKTAQFYLHSDDLSEEMLDNILKTAYATYDSRENEGDF